MSAVEVLEPGELSLNELAAELNREHRAGHEEMSKALSHWLRAGAILLQVRDRVERGKWTDWLVDNFDGQPSMAKFYVRMATYRAVLEDEGVTTLDDARRLIRGLPPIDNVQRRKGKELHDEARRLSSAGLSGRQIAQILDVTATSVNRWLNPALDARQKAAARAWKLRKQREVQEARQRRRDKAVRDAGGELAEAYSLLRKALQALDRADSAANSREVRAGARAALSKVYGAEDEIVRALGVA